MFENLIVPVDLGPFSFDAVPLATSMAAQVAGTVDVVTVVDRLADVPSARIALERAVDRLGPQPVETNAVVLADLSVASALTRHIETNPGSMLLMRSHGHGRSSAVVGGTVDEMLRAMFGPVIVVGPRATLKPAPLGGTYIVPVDGSARAEGVIPIVAAWAIEFGGAPRLVEVVESEQQIGTEVAESSYVQAQASQLQRRIGRPIQFDVLHGTHAAGPIVDFAVAQDASLIFMATHGRTGFERLRMGSVAADIVRMADAPVIMFRPPNYLRRNASPTQPVASRTRAWS